MKKKRKHPVKYADTPDSGLSFRFSLAGLIQLMLCVVLVLTVLNGYLREGVYYSYHDTAIRDPFTKENGVPLSSSRGILQGFTAQGNLFSNLKLYLGDEVRGDLTVEVFSLDGTCLVSKTSQAEDLTANAWNTIDISLSGLKRGREYLLHVTSENEGTILFRNPEAVNPAITSCRSGNEPVTGALAAEFQFTVKYVTAADFLEFLTGLCLVFLGSAALCFAVWRLEMLYCLFCQAEKKQGILYALYCAVNLTLLFHPLDTARTEVRSFQRMIGIGLSTNVDVDRRIHNFLFLFGFFSIVFLLFCLLFHFIRSSKRLTAEKENEPVLHFLDHIIVLANMNLLLRCVTWFHDSAAANPVFHYSAYLLAFLLLAGFVYVWWDLGRKITAKGYLQLMLSGYSVSYPLAVLSSFGWRSGRLQIGVWAVIFLLLVFYIRYGKINFKGQTHAHILQSTLMASCVFPFATSFYIELINILNQHSVFIAHPRIVYLFMTIGILLCAGAILYMQKKHGNCIKSWKMWSCLWLVFGISCLMVQPPLEKVYDAHIFEAANSSILISDFLNFGNIPLVEHYGGHMMYSVWEGLLYALLNGDYAGAIFSPYSGFPFFSVLFFLMMRQIQDEDTALWATLIFPFQASWMSFRIGILVYLAIIAYTQKNTFMRAALIWLAFAWCTICRLDTGAAFGGAAIATLIIYRVFYGNRKTGKHLVLSLFVVGVCGVSVWSALCIWKGINPFTRLGEFLLISLPNQNWAYTGIGNTGNPAFSWCYLLVPVSVSLCLLYTVFIREFREQISVNRWILLLILGFSFFANFQRGLVRHSLAEGSTGVIWTAYIFLAVFISCFWKEKKLFLPCFAVLLLCNTLFLRGDNFASQPIVDTAVQKLGSSVDTWGQDQFAGEQSAGGKSSQTMWERLHDEKKVVQRTVWSSALKEKILPYQKTMELLLADNETYVDFMNRSFVYSAINRRNPVYVAQSPLHLSGEFTQTQFVREIEKDISDIPLAILPVLDDTGSVNLDTIANTYRYYKVAEFLYQHYRPLCSYGEFAVWCLPERYEMMRKQLSDENTDSTERFLQSRELQASNCTIETDLQEQTATIGAHSPGPIVFGLQNVIDLEPYQGMNLKLSLDYESSVGGIMRIYYTTDKGEGFTGEKVVSTEISASGTAEFIVPVTEYTTLRLDIPNGSTVKIKSFRAGFAASLIDYGYDGPYATVDSNGNRRFTYDVLHTYRLAQIPRIWAEKDSGKAAENTVIADLEKRDSLFLFEPMTDAQKERGNYLLLSSSYPGTDRNGLVKDDDETVEATLTLGTYENDVFTEKYRYAFTLQEGLHTYLLRISSDYYWYSDRINAVKLQCGSKLYDVNMKILEGD